MTERLHRPTVGLMPTTPHADDGQTIDPFVSVPTARAVRLAETAAPDPELDPQGFRLEGVGIRALSTATTPTARGPLRPKVGPFAEVRLSQDDGASFTQLQRDVRIDGWDRTFEG